MPYHVEQLENLNNVVLVTFSGELTAHDVSQAVAAVVTLAEDMPRPCYQIGDFRAATGDFRTVMQITQTFPAIWRIYADEQITGPVVVNDLGNPWLKLSSQLARTMSLKAFMVFATIEDALEFVRKETKSVSD